MEKYQESCRADEPRPQTLTERAYELAENALQVRDIAGEIEVAVVRSNTARDAGELKVAQPPQPNHIEAALDLLNRRLGETLASLTRIRERI